MMKEFKGVCKGVRVVPKKGGFSVILITEDDENWHDGDRFDSHWIDELMEKLEEAKKYLKTKEQ